MTLTTSRFLRRAAAIAAVLGVTFAASPAADAATEPATYVVTVASPATRIGVRSYTKRMSAVQAASFAMQQGVRAVAKDATVRIFDQVTNPKSWGLDRIDQRAMPLSGSLTRAYTGTGVTAYIIDTGVNLTHSEFSGRVLAGFDAYGQGGNDCNGHGTHVAGTVGGTTYGIAPSVSIVPVRVLDCNGSGSWSSVVAGMNWVIDHHVAGPAVVNMSLGGGASSVIDDAISRMVADGITVAVAAGNSSTDACNTSPARAPLAITTAASDALDARAYFSNFGRCVDLFAPGMKITSAWTGSTVAVNTISGTSMASPHVAGVAALMLEKAPAATPADVTAAMKRVATQGVLTGTGSNTPNLLLYADPSGDYGVTPPTPSAPSAPPAPSATAGDTTATISWRAANPNGSPITSYAAYDHTGTRVCETNALSCVATGLANGSLYTFTVTATNAIGTSTNSAPSASVRPAPAPNTPLDVVAVARRGQVTVSWTPGASNGATLRGFRAVSSPDAQSCTATATQNTCNVTDLVDGRAYRFFVVAIGDVVESAPSALSNEVVASAPVRRPSAPKAVTALADDQAVALSWVPGANGGGEVTFKVYLAGTRRQVCETTTTSCVVEGLTNGVFYSFYIYATNEAGQSTAPAYSNSARPYEVRRAPSTPLNVSVFPNATGFALAWDAPVKRGGSPVSGYRVKHAATGSVVCTTLNRDCVVTMPSGSHSFVVEAANVFGWGPASQPTAPASAKPSAPSAPRLNSVSGGVRSVSVAFNTPLTDGGSPITAYHVAVFSGSTLVKTVQLPSATGRFSSLLVSGLAAGSYQVRLTAANAIGMSTPVVVFATARSR